MSLPVDRTFQITKLWSEFYIGNYRKNLQVKENQLKCDPDNAIQATEIAEDLLKEISMEDYCQTTGCLIGVIPE